MSDPTSPKDAVKANQLIEFLHGSMALDGVWFGDEHPTLKGKYWWRKHLLILEDPAEVRKQALLEAAEICDQLRKRERKQLMTGDDFYEAANAIRKLAEEE
jgi:predicted alpha-1,6-mannanase (GH76 family)